MDKKLEASPGRGLASEEIEQTTGSKTPLNCTSPTELSTPQLRQYQVEVIEQCRQRPEGNSTGRVYCRNPKCRSKLKAPTDNYREAFCTRGCHSSFYLHRCLALRTLDAPECRASEGLPSE